MFTKQAFIHLAVVMVVCLLLPAKATAQSSKINENAPYITWQVAVNTNYLSKILPLTQKCGFGGIRIETLADLTINQNCRFAEEKILTLLQEAAKKNLPADYSANPVYNCNLTFPGEINDLVFILADSLRPDTTIRYTIDSLKPPQASFLKTYAFSANYREKIETDWLLDKSNYTPYYQPSKGWKLYFLYTQNTIHHVDSSSDCFSLLKFNNTLSFYNQKTERLLSTNGLKSISINPIGTNGINLSEDVLHYFKETRFYDLFDYLYIFINDFETDVRSRILSDYYETISEFVIHSYYEPAFEWAKKLNTPLRLKTDNLFCSVLDIYTLCDIPESMKLNNFCGTASLTDISSILRFPVSAANTQNKNKASIELSYTMREKVPFLSLSEIKNSIDYCFTIGINQINLHSNLFFPFDKIIPYEPDFYPTESQINSINQLTEYIKNCQQYLQTSTPDNDLLIYFPIYDFWNTYNSSVLHNDTTFQWLKTSEFANTCNQLEKNGLLFDYISDKQIQALTTKQGRLFSGKSAYKALLIPKCQMLPITVINKIMELADNGAKIYFIQGLPKDVPGFYKYETNRMKLLDLKYALFVNRNIKVIQDIKELETYTIKGESLTGMELQFIRRGYNNNLFYFIKNQEEKEFNNYITLNYAASAWEMYDPETGKRGLLKKNDKNEFHLQLKEYGSCFLFPARIPKDPKTAKYFSNIQTLPDILPVQSIWSVTFPESERTDTLKMPVLIPLNYAMNEEIKFYSGKVKYEAKFMLPENKASIKNYMLSFEELGGSAEVYLNDFYLGTVWTKPYRVFINEGFLDKENLLEIYLTTHPYNQLLFYSKQPESVFKDKTLNGLAGKVELIPVKVLE